MPLCTTSTVWARQGVGANRGSCSRGDEANPTAVVPAAGNWMMRVAVEDVDTLRDSRSTVPGPAAATTGGKRRTARNLSSLRCCGHRGVSHDRQVGLWSCQQVWLQECECACLELEQTGCSSFSCGSLSWP